MIISSNNIILGNYKYKKNNNSINKWLIILTTALNVNYENKQEDIIKRRNIYLKQIYKWLKYTSFDIVLVESTGIGFPKIQHTRLHKYTIKLPKYPSSSKSEANSLLYVMNNIQNEIFYKNCTHILKITGRYYLNNLKYVLNNIPEDYDLYLQIHKNDEIKWQNTEYYGIRKNLFNSFLLNVKDDLMEHAFYKFIYKYKFKIARIGPFYNDIARGGDGLIINPL